MASSSVYKEWWSSPSERLDHSGSCWVAQVLGMLLGATCLRGRSQEETQQPRRERAKERALKNLSFRFPGNRCFHFRWWIRVSDVCPGACTWAPRSPGWLHVAQGPHVPSCHHAVTLPMGPHTGPVGEDPPPGPESGLGSRRTGTGWRPCCTPLSSQFWLSLRQAAQCVVNQCYSPWNLSTALIPSQWGGGSAVPLYLPSSSFLCAKILRTCWCFSFCQPIPSLPPTKREFFPCISKSFRLCCILCFILWHSSILNY